MMPRRSPALVLLALVSCTSDTTKTPTAPTVEPSVDGLAWARTVDLGDVGKGLATNGASVWALVDNTVLVSEDSGESWSALPDDGLPDGTRHWLGHTGGALLIDIDGEGLHRFNGTSWSALPAPPRSVLLNGLNPRLSPVPYGASGPAPGFLATLGGLYRTEDGGNSWSEVALGADAGFNLLFTDVAVSGDHVLAGAFWPAGLLPEDFSGLLSGALFESTDGGTTWTNADPDTTFRYASGVATNASGEAWVAALDGGLHHRIDGEWVDLGGPSDALDVSVHGDGVSVISATRGVWRLSGGAWTGSGSLPMAGLTDTLALDASGQLFTLAEQDPTAGEAPGDATVHIALSMHVNLYHSYRGDSNTDDGYGIDLDVMRTTLDWLDAHPRARCDWDIENHFSLGEWMQTDGADVLARLQERVAAGTDEVRPMSWNNGAMANHTEREFKSSMTRARESLDDVFRGHAPIVQPQECMITADHLRWYPDVGIPAITLFYSGTPFTALRFDTQLPKKAWYAPFSLFDPDDPSAAMTTVPVYHHADLVSHGGLAGWATQIHEHHEGDQLLTIHFDADAESWTAFEAELAAAEALPFVEFTLLSDYLDEHPPELAVPLPGDTADGTGDGFQSWAEKDFNHRLATTIALARETALRAEHLAGDSPAPDVQSHLDAALEARLLSLSTTHFGLAAPVLHPDRIASAEAFAATALSEAQAALALLTSEVAPGEGEIYIDNPHNLEGTVVVDVPIQVSATDYAALGTDGLWVTHDGTHQALDVTAIDDTTDPVQLMARLPLALPPSGRLTLQWGFDDIHPRVDGTAEATDILTPLPLSTPFTECAGERTELPAVGTPTQSTGSRAAVSKERAVFDATLCDGTTSAGLTWDAEQWPNLPGTLLRVRASMPDATGGTATDDNPWNLDAESVALSPLVCEGGADTLHWRALSGALRSRPVRDDQATWNGQATDSWVALDCADGRTLQVSHAALERTSLAFAPMRTLGDDGVLAPLGTLWGPPVRHDVRRTGGHGAGDVITPVVGSQFRPAAPDWSQAAVDYTLWLDPEGTLTDAQMTLFAHPPLVRVSPTPTPTDDSPDDTGSADTGNTDTGSADSGAPPAG